MKGVPVPAYLCLRLLDPHLSLLGLGALLISLLLELLVDPFKLLHLLLGLLSLLVGLLSKLVRPLEPFGQLPC